MNYFMYILLAFLVVCAVAVSFSRNLLNSILIFMSYSLIMSIIWILLESPDLAITEAAVGAGVTTVLFLVTLKKLHTMQNKEASSTSGEGALEAEKKEVIAAGFDEKDTEYTSRAEIESYEITEEQQTGGKENE